MKLETAKKLKWPWETKAFYTYPNSEERIYDPSVEEMMERMPAPLVIYMLCETGGTMYFTVDYLQRKHVEASRLREALALLCIWLIKNKMM